MKDIDVLIVGGGPTGLMMGLELVVQKVSFRIVDKLPGRSDKTRALGCSLVLLPLVMNLLLGTAERRRKRFRQSKQLNIRYRRSPIVGTSSTYNGPLFGGDRVPDGELDAADGNLPRLHGLLTGPGHHLLLFSGTGSQTLSEDVLLRTTEEFLNHNSSWTTRNCIVSSAKRKYAHVDSKGILHKRFGFQKPGYVLVRPDSHVAYIGLVTEIKDLISFVGQQMRD